MHSPPHGIFRPTFLLMVSDDDLLRIDPAAAQRLWQRGEAVFLDARRDEAWAGAGEQLPGALRWDGELGPIEGALRGRTVVAYCS